ncbi:MAG: PocR ligand-binding domain-containing protein [Bacteroidales bacterium]
MLKGNKTKRELENEVSRLQKELEILKSENEISNTRLEILDQPATLQEGIVFEDLFDIKVIQQIQDEFSSATGVASIITYPDGRPITRPSNFTRFCNEIVRKTEKGCHNCYKSDAELGAVNEGGPIIRQCLSGGLWDSGTSISVEGHHIANWLVGQVRNETQSEDKIREYARIIEADEEDMITAFREVPAMSQDRFNQVARLLYSLAKHFSVLASHNLQQARFIKDHSIIEAALKTEQLFTEKILDSLPGIFYLYSYPELRLVRWNKNHEKLLGYEEGEIEGRFILEWFLESDRPEVEKAVEHVMITGANVIESSLLSKNGQYVPYLMTGVRFENKGKKFLMGIGIDITNKKKADEELLRAKDKAEESDKLKSAFLANMSHEIRTPMNGILGFAQLLKEPELSSETQQEFIEIIEKSGSRMLDIINDLIDISKIEAGQMEVTLSETNLYETLDFLYSFFKADASKKGIDLSFYSPLNQNEAAIITDSGKLYAILTNLIKNAIKFTNKGNVNFGYEMMREFAEFYVADSGIGIPEDKQKTVLERFVQADIKLSSGYEGAGLGLSISRAYIEMLGGKLRLESEPGVGSKFYFTIPVSNASQ